nr:trans-cinnamate 4-monooxygenase [Quercus suber]POE94732.1 trans-cinnamate 4-monooxygenase [Quercus suber]
MTQRGREFDRSDFFKQLFAPVFPKNQISMPTNNDWRYNRLLMKELMSPAFLDGVAAPLIHSSTLDLVDTWRHKARLAKGHPFEAHMDVQFATLDSICRVSFGSQVGLSKSQANAFAKLTHIDLPARPEAVVSMPKAELPEAWYALHDTVTSGEIALSSPLGSWHHCALDEAWNKFRDTKGLDRMAAIKCAADWIVERESKLAQKGGKVPDSQILFDELAGFLQAGFDTTSSSIVWGLKYLTGYQDVQQKLRQSMIQAFSDAKQTGRQPTADEISKTALPYLDAFIEESLRCSCIISVNIRVATQDAPLLGCVVPKGTDVYMLVCHAQSHGLE